MAVWKSRAVNYVWAKQSPKGAVWPSAYGGERKMMVAVRSQEDSPSSWVVEKRNVREDFAQYFGQGVREIDIVAVMTDSDDTGTSARAYYGDIYFSAQ
jgi:hypothetical protein